MATNLKEQLKKQSEQYSRDPEYRIGVDELCIKWMKGVANHKIKLTIGGLISWIAYQQLT